MSRSGALKLGLIAVVLVASVWLVNMGIDRYLEHQADAIFQALGVDAWPNWRKESPRSMQPAWPVVRAGRSDTIGYAHRVISFRDPNRPSATAFVVEARATRSSDSLALGAPGLARLAVSPDGATVEILDTVAAADSSAFLCTGGQGCIPLIFAGDLDSLVEARTRLEVE